MRSSANIELPGDEECAFCAYLRGDRPYTVLTRTQDTATLVTREQRGEPHLLVIPLRHVSTILELTDHEAATLLVSARDAARLIDKAYSKPGIAIWQNNGVPAGQAISHFHIHVAGTLSGGGTLWGDVEELDISETEKIAKRLLVFADQLDIS